MTDTKHLPMYAPGIRGCRDVNCVLRDNSTGMVTNGGCRCEVYLRRTEEGRGALRTMRYLRHKVTQAEGARDALRESAKMFRLNDDPGEMLSSSNSMSCS